MFVVGLTRVFRRGGLTQACADTEDILFSTEPYSRMLTLAAATYE